MKKHTNGTLPAGATSEFSDLPQGLAAAFCQNAAAMTVFTNLPEDKKREVIDLAKSASSKKEMINIVQPLTVHTLPD